MKMIDLKEGTIDRCFAAEKGRRRSPSEGTGDRKGEDQSEGYADKGLDIYRGSSGGCGY